MARARIVVSLGEVCLVGCSVWVCVCVGGVWELAELRRRVMHLICRVSDLVVRVYIFGGTVGMIGCAIGHMVCAKLL